MDDNGKITEVCHQIKVVGDDDLGMNEQIQAFSVFLPVEKPEFFMQVYGNSHTKN